MTTRIRQVKGPNISSLQVEAEYAVKEPLAVKKVNKTVLARIVCDLKIQLTSLVLDFVTWGSTLLGAVEMPDSRDTSRSISL